MVAEQGETVNKIEKATENAALDFEEGTVQIKQVIYHLALTLSIQDQRLPF